MIEPKIFISHSASDTEIGNKFLLFLESLGFNRNEIFYSSKYHNGVELGKNFPDVVKNSFKESNLIVFLLTPNFYDSPYCLNEMGAAWICDDKEIVPILLGDLTFSDMKGFIGSQTKSFSPKHSEQEELYTFFSKRTSFDFNKTLAKKRYNEFLKCSIQDIKLNDELDISDLDDKAIEILSEINSSKNMYAIYSNILNVVQINCNNKNLCLTANAVEKIQYKEAMEKLLQLGYVECRKKRNLFNFIYPTTKGLEFLKLKEK